MAFLRVFKNWDEVNWNSQEGEELEAVKITILRDFSIKEGRNLMLVEGCVESEDI